MRVLFPNFENIFSIVKVAGQANNAPQKFYLSSTELRALLKPLKSTRKLQIRFENQICNSCYMAN